MAATRVYNVSFEGDLITTTVTASGAAVEGWLDEVPAVHRRRLHKLVVGRRCLIFQLLHADYIPDALDEFFGDDSDYTFVGVGVQADADRLSNDYQLEVARTVDLADLAAEEMGRPDLRNAGLKGIAAAVMDAHVEKAQLVRTGRWDEYYLSDEQVKYACIDAFVSFEVGRRLLNGDY